MMKPWEPPEKRPSVISATCLPKPAPMIALVGVNISLMPGPPFGPSYLITTKSPFWIFPCSSPRSIASSPSNTLAGPVKVVPSLPVILATEPSGHKLPYKILMLPLSWMHLSIGLITSCALKSRSGIPAKFSATVRPVQVIQSPCNQPSFSKYFITTGVPPIWCTSSIRYFPLGFRSPSSFVLSLIRWKSSTLSSMPAVLAMASRCKTALVDPPKAFTMTIAFSKDFLVKMSSGFKSRSNRALIAAAVVLHSSRFSGDKAGLEDVYGKASPNASTAVAIVLAVYMPPQAPAPGQACRTTSRRSSSSMVPAMYLPYASNVETMSSVSPCLDRPEAMVPPYIINEGLLTRIMAMTHPGMFLSQPGMVTKASYHCAPITVSMLSAMISRDGKE
mmetsp:Transcript_11041/g.20034  ORF Transcript_11041/g.20034 Transcript_11041/m.20034 type:complete len:390 (+) Transcript_11041:309-1478(+)